MKKSLLLASALLCAASSFAQDMTISPEGEDVKRMTDPAQYEKFGEYELKNRWILSRNTDGSEVIDAFFQSEKNQASAVVLDTVIYVARPNNGSLLKFGLATGRYLGELKLTMNGESIGTGISVMLNLTKDDFGHLVYHGYKSSVGMTQEGEDKGGLKICYVSNIETGECAEVAELAPTLDELINAYTPGRIDYTAIAGDITRQDARAVVIAGAGVAGLQIYGWECEQGSDEWKGAFPDRDGGGNPDVIMLAPVAADGNVTQWSSAGGTSSAIVYDPEYTGALFYIDGVGNMPGLYDRNGNFVENGTHHTEEVMNEETGTMTVNAVRNCETDWLVSASNATGIIEFTLNGTNFVAYADGDHGATAIGGANAKIAKLGDNFEWTAEAGAKMAWAHVPAAGMGLDSDGGRRKIILSASIMVDDNDVEGAYFLVGHNHNGMALYTIAPEGWQDPNGQVDGIEDIVADEVEGAAKYYNLQGVEVANPENGLYIVKRGNKVAKELVK